MAGIVADYKVIKDGPVVLRAGNDIDVTFEFSLPRFPIAPDEPAIISFLLLGSNNLRLKFVLNGTDVSDRIYSAGPERCIQDVIQPRAIQGGTNQMTLIAVTGEVRLSSLVLWFQRNADDTGKVTAGLF
jgi:hypothetical protein